MPRSSRYHALSEDFRNFVANHGGWPLENKMFLWMRTGTNGGIKSDGYTTLKQGGIVPEKYLAGLLRMRHVQDAHGEVRRFGKVINQYFAEQGVQDADAVSVAEALALVCGPPKDWFLRGVEGLLDLFGVQRKIERIVRPCRTAAEVREAVQAIYFRLGCEQLGDYDVEVDDATGAASARMGSSLQEYQEGAIGWARRDPWAVVRVWGERKPIATSIVLGLSETGYQAVGSGHSPRTLTDRHFRWPSDIVLIELAGSRRPEIGGESRDSSRGLLLALLCQIAWLSRRPTLGIPTTLRVLAFAGSEENANRTRSFGFKNTGRMYAGTDIPLLERMIAFSASGVPAWTSPKDLLLGAFLVALREDVREVKELACPPPLPSS